MSGPAASSAVERARRARALVTPTLDTRAYRPPDYAGGNESMHRLAHALTSSDGVMLQTLSDMALHLCEAGSAGIELLERDTDGAPVFRWVAVSGRARTR